VAKRGRPHGVQAEAAAHLKLEATVLNRWLKNRDAILRQAKADRGRRGRGYAGKISFGQRLGPKPRYPEEEQRVMDKFRAARARLAAVSRMTLRRWMKAEVWRTRSFATFVASNRWFSAFATRNNITLRRRTTTKVKSVAARLPLVAVWLHMLQRRVTPRRAGAARTSPTTADNTTSSSSSAAATASSPSSSSSASAATTIDEDIDNADDHLDLADMGRFPNRYNVDQVPCELQPGGTETYEQRGASGVAIAHAKSGDKRMCTLQVLCRLRDGVPQPSLGIIFRGKGIRLPQEERAAIEQLKADGVDVYFQPKAWADTDFCVDWARRTLGPYTTKHHKGEATLLFMDNLSSQCSEEFKEELPRFNIKPHFFPAGTTDMI